MAKSIKINCIFHKEETASLALYNTGQYHCFGCSAHGSVEDLNLKDFDWSKVEDKPEYVEDIEKTLAYVGGLPRKTIRGLLLPYDDMGYYVVWPNVRYYCRRNHAFGKGAPKYYNPSGVVKPMYLQPGHTVGRPHMLLVVEGQLNAASIAEAHPFLWVASPGGAGDFTKKEHLDFYKEFDKVLVIADDDAAGRKACIELSALLMSEGIQHVKARLMKQDANDILANEGPDRLREKINEFLAGMAL